MLIDNITVREDCRWTNQVILHSKISSPPAVKSSAQSLDYRANSYHIYLNTLGFYGCGKEISQICTRPFCPINTSFSGTPPPSCHSTASNLLSWRRHCLRTPKNPSKDLIQQPSRSSISPSLGKKWPSTSSSPRSVYHPHSFILLLYSCSSTILFTEYFFLFLFVSFSVPPSSKPFRSWPIRL